MSECYLCIHGHFYQPPRENAWLEAVEVQDSAYPYHDWNWRISAECYSANAYSRILDTDGRIERIVSNYEKISFNFGPTLLAWLEINIPMLYEAILEADRKSCKRFQGHGSGLAQAYNHMIMPLASRRDKYTQVLWGIRDFFRRFDRTPEGMWLPETAVDMETLEIMAKLGIRFTILSPAQAAMIRSHGEADWRDVSDGSIDPKVPYRQNLPSGASISLFFYDGPISRAVAFEGLLQNGAVFADRLNTGFVERKKPQLLHIATDGESYGHHSRFGDMALAYALQLIESQGNVRLTNYGAFLSDHPPSDEVQIKEFSSWSCAHGIERWRSDCGCASGRHPGWHQRWRAPLRQAFDWLRDVLDPAYENACAKHLKDPWKARDDYIAVVNDRSSESIERFFQEHASGARCPADNVRLLKLLEMQRHAMLMFTSCGWFFDEISGIETVQVIQYAGRAIQLYTDLFGGDLESRFLEKLVCAEGNIAMHPNGRIIYEKFVKPAMVDLKRVTAHYAIQSIFGDDFASAAIFCCSIFLKEYHRTEAGYARMAAGRVEITSDITQETEDLDFGVFHSGDHHLTCGITGTTAFDERVGELFDAFDRADFTRVVQKMDHSFGGDLYSLKSLFKDGQRRILNIILKRKVAEALTVYRHVYEPNVPLIRFLKDSDTPVPAPLYASGRFVLNTELTTELERSCLDEGKIADLLREAELAGISLDSGTLEYTLRRNLEEKADAFHEHPDRTTVLEEIAKGVDLVYTLPFDVNLRRLQNVFYDVKKTVYPSQQRKTAKGDADAAVWTPLFETLCRQLNLRLDSE